MASTLRQTTPIGKSALGGLTVLLVVAMAFSPSDLPAGYSTPGQSGHRAVAETPRAVAISRRQDTRPIQARATRPHRLATPAPAVVDPVPVRLRGIDAPTGQVLPLVLWIDLPPPTA